MELRRLRRLEEKGVEEEEEGEAGSGCWRSLVFTEVILLETSAEAVSYTHLTLPTILLV